MSRFTSFAVLSSALLAAACGSGNEHAGLKISRVSPQTVVPTNYTCSTVTYYLGRSFGDSSFVIDPVPASPFNQTFSPIDAAGDSLTLGSSDGIHFAWSSTALIRAIFIRADEPGTALGDATNQIWLYANPSGGGAYSGAGIYTEDDTHNLYPAKYVEFCFDAPPPPPEYSLTVTKTAKMAYDKKFEWYLFKTTDPVVTSLTLSTGQVADVSYLVTFGVNGILTSNYAVSGTINIHNPAPIAATITSIADTLEGATSGTMNCGVVLPYQLAPGADLVCTYGWTVPNGDDRLDTAVVTTEGAVKGGTATATAYYSEADVTLIDACATVTDDRYGALGVGCWDQGVIEKRYTLRVGPYEACGDFQFKNVATLVTDTTQTQLTADYTIPVAVPCDVGCTLTPGYWKTHSQYGPAPYDDTWASIGEDTAFFLSGLTWYTQFWATSAGGNAYFILSRAYAAARLNELNGASMGAVAAQMADALWLLEHYTPQYIGSLKGGDALRQRFLADYTKLDAFNNGLIGPGHCSEQTRQ